MHRNTKIKRQQTHCQSLLLATVRPFHWVFAIFVITPAPCLTYNAVALSSGVNYLARLIYALYSLTMFSLTILSSYVNSIYATKVVVNYNLDGLTNVLSKAVSIAVPFVQVLSQLITMLRYRQLMRIFDDIEQLEHDIRWRSLLKLDNAGAHFGNIFRRELFKKSGLLLIFMSTLHAGTDFMLTGSSMGLQYRLMSIFFSLLIQMKSVEFCVAVQLVHALLRQLFRELRYVRRQFISALAFSDERRMLYAALHYNQQLLARIWQLVDTMESYFAIPMLALFLYNALTITHTVNWAYIMQKSLNHDVISQNSFRLVFTLVILMNMLVPCWLCQSCIQTYELFATELHKFRSNGSDIRLSCCLREYSLQMLHQKLLFTCGGFFDINLQHFGVRVLTITTYVVILIQFKLQAEAEEGA